MEKFMLIFIGGNEPEVLTSPESMQAYMQEWFAWIEKLRKAGKYEGGEALEPSGKGITGPKNVVTDGPFAEGKELVGGYFVIKAKNIDEAVTMSKDCPGLKYSCRVEVRPVMNM